MRAVSTLIYLCSGSEVTEMIHLKEMTPENWRIPLRVSPQQEKYVANSMTLLARAYAYRHLGSVAYVIYEDELPVGMALYYDCPSLNAYDFSQFFIDERYQGKGYGKKAAQLLIDHMKQEGRFEKILLCYVEGNEGARILFESLGFKHTGDIDGDEITMELVI